MKHILSYMIIYPLITDHYLVGVLSVCVFSSTSLQPLFGALQL